MLECVSAFKDLGFEKDLLPTSNYFLVKNKQSEAVTISSSFSDFAGYKNPIDYLGKTDHSLRCPAVELANTYIAQDKEVINQKCSNLYISITSYPDQELKLGVFEKKYQFGYIVCNMHLLENSLLSKSLSESIQHIDPKHIKKINRCYEVVRSYLNLSTRETQVLYFLIRRRSSSEIGNLLHLSNRTIQHYMKTIKEKLSCNTIQQVIELSLFLGLHKMIPESLM